MKHIVKEFDYGKHRVKLEYGRIAKQATAAVMATMGDNMVLCTVVLSKQPKPDQGFLPLTVNYQEKSYSGGRIPGSFFRREGRPSEKETLTSRLIDRPIRPMFAKDFRNEVQVICTVMSADKELDSDIPAMFGASAALALSGAPISGTMAAARVGFVDGAYVLNPSFDELEKGELNMVVAGAEDAILMVESGADELSEELMLGAVLCGFREMQTVITVIKEMVAESGRAPWPASPVSAESGEFAAKVSEFCLADVRQAYQITDKLERQEKLAGVYERGAAQFPEEGSDGALKGAIKAMEKSVVRERILEGESRIDGRDRKTVRPISIDVGLLPGAHGSTLFTRGETQAVVTTTLGGDRDAALVESLQSTDKDYFMLHYNFPPYCVGEAGFMGGPKRREIGHGRLARRAVEGVLPDRDSFPYSLRVVSEITESNGSSSMATVCGASLAMMDAGVPISAPVAGVAMGLIKEGDRFAVLTDILGDEDHLGDMDFKVAGTRKGITALQMDIKIQGVDEAILETALSQAQKARIHVLDEMAKVLAEPRPEVAENAPSFRVIEIPRDKIGALIGKGGKNIRSITETTGASIDIDDGGQIRIAASSRSAGEEAIRLIEESVADPEEVDPVNIGSIYPGVVKSIVRFGAFVRLPQGVDGLLHISQIANQRIENVEDFLSEGQELRVKVVDVDDRGRIKLTIRDLEDSA